MSKVATIGTVRRLLRKNKPSSVLSLLQDAKNESLIENDSLDLVAAIFASFKDNSSILKEKATFEIYSKMIEAIITKGKPKEIVLSIMEAADTFIGVEVYLLMLESVRSVLLSAHSLRGEKLKWIMDVFGPPLWTMPKPGYDSLGDDEINEDDLFELNQDLSVQDLTKALCGYIQFLEPFINETLPGFCFPDGFVRNPAPPDMFANHMMILFGDPLLYHDLHWDLDQSPTVLQQLCLQLVGLLSKVSKTIFNLSAVHFLYCHPARYGAFTEDKPINKTYSTLSFLVFCQNLYKFRPYVYSSIFLFESQVHLINFMIQHTSEHFVLVKGLCVCEALLKHLPAFSLPGPHIHSQEYIELIKGILTITVFSKVRKFRKQSLKCFKTLMEKFSWEQRYGHLLSAITSFSHPGLQGYIIMMYKDFLYESFKNLRFRHHFCGTNLHKFLKIILVLPDGIKTDLLEHCDKIMSCLNFVRFLVLLDDKEQNGTGVWDVIASFKSSYFEVLNRGIETSVTCYQMNALEGSPSDNQVFHHGLTFLQFLENGIVRFDMMKSVLSRLLELIE